MIEGSVIRGERKALVGLPVDSLTSVCVRTSGLRTCQCQPMHPDMSHAFVG